MNSVLKAHALRIYDQNWPPAPHSSPVNFAFLLSSHFTYHKLTKCKGLPIKFLLNFPMFSIILNIDIYSFFPGQKKIFYAS